MSAKVSRKPCLAKAHIFSQAFEQMCSVVAIADTQSSDDTLRQLILQCFVVCPDDHLYKQEDVADRIRSLFGLQIPQHRVDAVFIKMIEDGCIVCPNSTNYTLPLQVRTALQVRIDEANTLEITLKNRWMGEVAVDHPAVDSTQLWDALRDYLARAFGRHGILTAALLDPSIDATAEQSQSLASLLDGVVDRSFPQEQRAEARTVISDFLGSVVDHPDRATYIAQLANGAFNYYSLAVAPDVSAQLQAHLSDLTLFLDTNFLLGILDLHEHHLVEISRQLLDDIKTHKLPFKLRFHPFTQDEMRATLDYYGSRLRRATWTPALSQAVLAQVSMLSGIERKYHQMNAARKIDVSAFLSRYDHVDELLKDQGIDIHRTRVDQDLDPAKLVYDYGEYLKGRRARRKGDKKEKGERTIMHDMTLLAFVRRQRTRVASSLDAGALLLTCDAILCKFDWLDSRRRHAGVSTIMPDVLWQILRPFLLASPQLDREGFDRAFAATFAIPELRSIDTSGPREKARERMLYMLAKFEGLSEKTAARFLSNDLLLDRLRTDVSEDEFQRQVQCAALDDNAVLLEDKMALEQEIERQSAEAEVRQANMQAAHEVVLAALAEEREAGERARREREDTQRALDAERAKSERVRAEVVALQQCGGTEEEKSRTAIAQAEQHAREKGEAQERHAAMERQIQEMKDAQARRDKEREVWHRQARSIGSALAVSIILAACLVLLVWFVPWPPFTTIRSHPHSTGLMLAGIVIIICIAFMIAIPKWWTWIGGAVLLGVLWGVLQIV